MSERKPWIVCAACRAPSGFIAAGPRHYDDTMHQQIDAYCRGVKTVEGWEQGFIDQFGEFYTREEAYKIVQENGQPFDPERNTVEGELFSEGLY